MDSYDLEEENDEIIIDIDDYSNKHEGQGNDKEDNNKNIDIDEIEKQLDEYSGLVVDTENNKSHKKKKKKSKGKMPSKEQHLRVNLEKAKKIINVERKGTKYCSEGYYDTELPSSLENYITEQEYTEVIEILNKKLKEIPTLKFGYIPCTFWAIICFIVLIMLFFPQLNIWILLSSILLLLLSTIISILGFVYYFINQKKFYNTVLEQDEKYYQNGIRFQPGAINSGPHRLLIVIE
eukprot:TRINITY_DN7103_c0_g1_i2.p1 TRINITY_DN7103_c0_g1~~TRINITY_DN7103_c0_g1_i2.p1  ORF type:complete len:236 (-),score=59.60 TRINITY_DN7103_c0_g1_i2:100-807(-)